jgi:hypothetical protein
MFDLGKKCASEVYDFSFLFATMYFPKHVQTRVFSSMLFLSFSVNSGTKLASKLSYRYQRFKIKFCLVDNKMKCAGMILELHFYDFFPVVVTSIAYATFVVIHLHVKLSFPVLVQQSKHLSTLLDCHIATSPLLLLNL